MKKEILNWAKDRGLLQLSNAHAQTCKLIEESGELAGAILKNNHSEIVDAIGDIQVVLIILSEQLGVDYDKALETAYTEIKNRKGKMINGSFVKEK
jgi:NTP pyrophosphatase (non-canonical NTP hydrolase)